MSKKFAPMMADQGMMGKKGKGKGKKVKGFAAKFGKKKAFEPQIA